MLPMLTLNDARHLFFGTAQHRLLLGHLPLSPEFIDRVVDIILSGIE